MSALAGSAGDNAVVAPIPAAGPWDAETPSAAVDVELGGRRYRWTEYTTHPVPTRAWSHHGVVVGPNGEDFFVASPDGRALVHLDGGTARRLEDLDVTECHGMSVDAFDSTYSIWIADNGHKYGYRDRGNDLETDRPGRVIRADSSGRVLQTLDSGQLPDGAKEWRPTGVTSEPRDQGGRIWVADGYGQSFVHCFSREGDLLWSSDGAGSGTVFNSPHGILLDTRPAVPELLVADRGNRRIVVLGTDGTFLRTFGAGRLTSPSGFALDGELLWVTELFGAIVAFDRSDNPAAVLGSALESTEEGWPNVLDGDVMDRPPFKAGIFRSPHGIAVNAAGSIAVSEWVIGGRLIMLTPA
ncbi:NHL repeat-containing protein [Arthrobacter sp. TMN-37]